MVANVTVVHNACTVGYFVVTLNDTLDIARWSNCIRLTPFTDYISLEEFIVYVHIKREKTHTIHCMRTSQIVKEKEDAMRHLLHEIMQHLH